MPNLYNRVELVSPVEDPANRDQLTEVLDWAFADDTNSWELDRDGVWSRRTTDGDEPRSLQDDRLMESHTRRAEEAAVVRS